MALVTYNFIIKHKTGKINPINMLLKRLLGTRSPLKEDTTLLLL